jgi:hypothetical protein
MGVDILDTGDNKMDDKNHEDHMLSKTSQLGMQSDHVFHVFHFARF